MNRNRRGPYPAPAVAIRAVFVLFGVLCHSGTPVIAKESPARPNVLVIIADDLGRNDISLHCGATPTPHIDSLASSGVSFRNLIVNPVCSPTRAAFLTGCEAVRSGFGGEVGDRLNPAFPTIAQRFKAAGYRTGLFGKWHNGKPSSRQTTPWRPTPMKAGFDHFEGFYGGGTDFYNQTDTKKRKRNWYLNDSPSADEGYTTDLRRKHEQWLAKHGANVNYSPPSRVRETPEPPRGEVLALEFDAPPRHVKSRVLLPLAREALIRRHGLSREDFDCTPGDCLSYDMKIEALSAGQAAYVSPTREGALVFSCGGPGIDTDGGSVASTKARPAASGMWKHHVMGIGNLAAGSHSPPALVVESSAPGKIRVLFDNIRILKPDGRAIPVWTGGKAPVPTAPGLALTTRRIN